MDYPATRLGGQGPGFAYDPRTNRVLESEQLPFLEVARFGFLTAQIGRQE